MGEKVRRLISMRRTLELRGSVWDGIGALDLVSMGFRGGVGAAATRDRSRSVGIKKAAHCWAADENTLSIIYGDGETVRKHRELREQ